MYLLPVFDVGFGDVSPYECTEYLCSGYETEWLHLGKEPLTRWSVCYILSICNLVISSFGFEDRVLYQFLVIA